MVNITRIIFLTRPGTKLISIKWKTKNTTLSEQFKGQ
jgi:hypothetical protein